MDSRLSLFLRLFWQLVVLTQLLNAAPVYADGDSKVNPVLAVDPSIKFGKLNNGFSYYVRKNQTPKNSVELRLIVKYGAIDEAEQEQGAAHFIEHLVFHNTNQFGANTMVSRFEKIGVTMGGGLNAHTNYERTQYEISLPSNSSSHLSFAMRALADIAMNARFLPKDVAAEERIIDEEERMRASYGMRRQYMKQDVFLRGTVYEKRKAIGEETIRKNFSAKMLQDLYSKHYRAERMAVIVVGDIDVEQVRAKLSSLFASASPSAESVARPIADLPIYSQTSVNFMTDLQQSEHELEVLLSVRQMEGLQTEDTVRQGWIRRIYWELLSDRISRSLNYNGASAQEINLINNVLLGLLTLRFDGNAEKAIAALKTRLRQVQEMGFQQIELDDIRSDLQTENEQAYQEREKRSSNSYVFSFLNHFVYQTPLWSSDTRYEVNRRILKSITLEELNNFSQSISFDQPNFKTIYYAPKTAEQSLIKDKELLGALTKIDHEKLEVFLPRKRLKSLMKAAPLNPGSITAESYDSRLGVVEWKLSNGVTVLLKKTNFSNDKVTMFHRQMGERAKLSEAEILNGVVASSLTRAMGFDQLAPREIADYLNGKNISYSLSNDYSGRTILGQSATGNVLDLLQINYQRITNSSKNVGQFQNGIADIKQRVLTMSKQADSVLNDQLLRLMFNNDIRATQFPAIKDLEILNIDKVLDAYRQLNSNFDGSYFVFVGNLDLDMLRREIPKYLATLPSHDTGSTSELPFPPLAAGIIKRDIYYGEESNASVIFAFLGEAQQLQDLDRTHLALLNQIMTQRVRKNIRERQQLIYSSLVASELYDAGRGYATFMYFPTAPVSIESLEKALYVEIEQLRSQLVSEEELASVKKALIASHQQSLQNDLYVATQIMELKLGTASGELLLDPEKLLSKISVESIRQAAKRYYDLNRYVQVTRRPAAMEKINQNELDRYRKQIPRDLGYKTIRNTNFEIAPLASQFIGLLADSKPRESYIDPGNKFQAFERLRKQIESLEVSECLKSSKEYQMSRLNDLLAAISVVTASAENGREVGSAITDVESERMWRLIRRYLDMSKRIDVEMEKCVDGAPALP